MKRKIKGRKTISKLHYKPKQINGYILFFFVVFIDFYVMFYYEKNSILFAIKSLKQKLIANESSLFIANQFVEREKKIVTHCE